MPTYEDFTTYVENDGNLFPTTTRSTWTNLARAHSAYLYKNFGVGYFSTFICGFTLRLTDLNPDTTTARIISIGWMQMAGPLGEWGGNVNKLGIRVLASATSGKFGLDIIENNGTGDVNSSDIVLDENQDYYVIFEKIGQDCILSVYSDPGHETLVDSVSLVMRSAVAFHYMYPPVSIDSNSNPGDLSSGYVEYLTLDPEFTRSLAAEFEVRREFWRDLTARFVISGLGSEELFGKADVGQGWENLPAYFCIPQVYDFSAGRGVGFYWWGSGGVDQQVDFEMWSPTGGWVGQFYDGPASFRLVQLEWDDLTEVDIDGTRPDRSNINGMFWTYHTDGIRRVDGIHTWMNQDLIGRFIVRQTGTPSELYARAVITRAIELLGRAVIIRSEELYVRFLIR